MGESYLKARAGSQEGLAFWGSMLELRGTQDMCETGQVEVLQGLFDGDL